MGRKNALGKTDSQSLESSFHLLVTFEPIDKQSDNEPEKFNIQAFFGCEENGTPYVTLNKYSKEIQPPCSLDDICVLFEDETQCFLNSINSLLKTWIYKCERYIWINRRSKKPPLSNSFYL